MALLKLISTLCPEADSPLWRLLAFLKEHLPAGPDLADVQGLLVSAEQLRQECRHAATDRQQIMDFE